MAARKQRQTNQGGGRGRRRKADAAPATPPVPDQPSQTLANVTARRDYLAEACERMYQIDSEIKALSAKYLKPLREDKGDIMTTLRDEYYIPAAVFRARYYAYRLERQASDNEDNATLDVIRELFDSIPIGEVVDVMDGTAAAPASAAAEPAAPQPSALAAAQEIEREAVVAPAPSADGADGPTEEHDYVAAKQAGYDAGLKGESITTCPFKKPIQKGLKAEWEGGWENGQYARSQSAQNEGASAATH